MPVKGPGSGSESESDSELGEATVTESAAEPGPYWLRTRVRAAAGVTMSNLKSLAM